VATPDDFFGHEIHNMPAGARASAARFMSRSNSARDFENREMKSRGAAAAFATRHFASASLSSVQTSAGMPIRATRYPSLMPNFFGSGVPEYPGMESLSVDQVDAGSLLVTSF